MFFLLVLYKQYKNYFEQISRPVNRYFDPKKVYMRQVLADMKWLLNPLHQLV